MDSADRARALTVLIIEDHPDQRDLLEQVLQREGYPVITAADGMEALEKLEKQPAQIVISDIMMPRTDGFELVRKLRSDPKHKSIYLIFITARLREEDRILGLDLGANDYITKPFSFSEVLARLRVASRVVSYQQHLEHQALRDALTGLYNRRGLEKTIVGEFERARRYYSPVSLLILDIDNFKMINDMYGHHWGDEVLKRIAQTLQDKIRRSDFASRYGGEEFVLILPETNSDNAFQAAKKIHNAIKQLTFRTTAMAFSVTVSIGISSTSEVEYSNWMLLLKTADRALYTAKNNGKNRVEVFCGESHSLSPSISRKPELPAGIQP